jgi:hypothetical protein
MTLEAGERIDEGVRPEKRSAGAIFESIKSNRAALVLIGAVAFGGVMFVVSKNRTAEVAPTSSSQIAVPAASEADRGRDATDTRVGGLDSAAEDAAANKADVTNSTYMPPIPVIPPLASATPPPAPAARPVTTPQASSSATQAQKKKNENLEKAMQAQLARISAGVNGRGKMTSEAATLDTSALTSAGGSGYSENAGNGESRLGYPMGTIWRATLKTGANTDRPGTVQAVIEEGPFAGRTALCNFSWPTREYINLECFAVKLDTESLPLKMVAVGPDEMPAVKAEYNGKYIQRLGSMFLASFPAAYAEGLAMGGTTTTNGSATTSTEPELSGKDLTLYAAGQATKPISEEMIAMAQEIKPQAVVPPMQLIGLMLAEDI